MKLMTFKRGVHNCKSSGGLDINGRIICILTSSSGVLQGRVQHVLVKMAAVKRPDSLV